LRLVQRIGIGNPLAALCSRKRIDEEVRRTDQPLVHGCGSLKGQQLIDQGLVKTAAKLDQRCGQHKVGLRAVELDVCDATGIHPRHVGTQPFAEGFCRGAHFVCAQLQSQEYTGGNGATTSGGTFRETPGNACLDGLNHLSPGERLAPLADGIGGGNDIGNPQAASAPAEPMLKVAYKTHREGSRDDGVRMAQDTTIRIIAQSALGDMVNKLVTTIVRCVAS
jgi:hypothetical protein